MAYGSDFSQIDGKQGLNYFFPFSVCALRDLLEQVLAYLDVCQSWEEFGKLTKDQRKKENLHQESQVGFFQSDVIVVPARKVFKLCHV